MTPSTAKPVTVLCGLIFLIGPLAAVARQGLTPLLFLVLLTLAFVPESRAAWRALSKDKQLLFAAPFFAWALISMAWAPKAMVGDLGQLFAVVIGALGVVAGMTALSPESATRVLKAALIGVLVLLIFLLEEGMTKAAILSWARPEDIQNSDAMFFSLIMSLAARGTSVLAVLATLLSVLIYRSTRSGVAAALFLLVALFACARLPMTTSALGLAGAILAFVCVAWRPRFFFGFMLVLLAAGILLAGPAARFIPSQSDVSAAQSQLELGTQHRLGIWRYVAGLSAERPIIGHGFNTARHFAAKHETLEGLNLPALPTHPHNAPLQIWLELGAVGAVFSVVLLLGVWRAVQPILHRPVHSAVVASVVAAAAVIACFSYSLWSTWWLAALGLAGALAALAIKVLPPHLGAPE